MLQVTYSKSAPTDTLDESTTLSDKSFHVLIFLKIGKMWAVLQSFLGRSVPEETCWKEGRVDLNLIHDLQFLLVDVVIFWPTVCICMYVFAHMKLAIIWQYLSDLFYTSALSNLIRIKIRRKLNRQAMPIVNLLFTPCFYQMSILI